jgi:hypothetical protein
MMQIRHETFEFGTHAHGYFIYPGRNGCLGIYFFFTLAGGAFGGIRACFRKKADTVFDRIAKEFSVNIKVSNGIVFPFEFAF